MKIIKVENIRNLSAMLQGNPVYSTAIMLALHAKTVEPVATDDLAPIYDTKTEAVSFNNGVIINIKYGYVEVQIPDEFTI